MVLAIMTEVNTITTGTILRDEYKIDFELSKRRGLRTSPFG